MTTASTADVLVERRGRALVVTINRPAARNAINGSVSAGIFAAVEELEADNALSLGILTGAGGTFSSGMDLKAFLAGENVTVPGRGLAGICQVPPTKPIIAAVEGWALAGGFEVVLACDMVVAAQGAKFGVPEVKRGLVAGAGGLIRLPRRIPPPVAMELALTGDPITAQQALAYGLINRITPDGGALDGAIALAERITGNGPLAVTVSKQIMSRSVDWTTDDMWDQQSALMGPIFDSVDAREGARAFAERREPVWQGR